MPVRSLISMDRFKEFMLLLSVKMTENLYANFGDGNTWQWLNLGQPPSTPVSIVSNFRPISLTVPPDAAKSIFVFVVGNDGHVYACYSPSGGTGWQWVDLGLPPVTGPQPILSFSPNALRIGNESKTAVFNWNVSVFAVSGDSALWADSTPDASLGSTAVWTWQPRGAPPAAGVF